MVNQTYSIYVQITPKHAELNIQIRCEITNNDKHTESNNEHSNPTSKKMLIRTRVCWNQTFKCTNYVQKAFKYLN